MSIVYEYFRTRSDGVRLNRVYSDQDVMIRKVGTDEVYEEAIDVENAPWTYEETDQAIEANPEELLRIIEEGE